MDAVENTMQLNLESLALRLSKLERMQHHSQQSPTSAPNTLIDDSNSRRVSTPLANGRISSLKDAHDGDLGNSNSGLACKIRTILD